MLVSDASKYGWQPFRSVGDPAGSPHIISLGRPRESVQAIVERLRPQCGGVATPLLPRSCPKAKAGASKSGCIDETLPAVRRDNINVMIVFARGKSSEYDLLSIG